MILLINRTYAPRPPKSSLRGRCGRGGQHCKKRASAAGGRGGGPPLRGTPRVAPDLAVRGGGTVTGVRETSGVHGGLPGSGSWRSEERRVGKECGRRQPAGHGRYSG